jgi:hypothetical protein
VHEPLRRHLNRQCYGDNAAHVSNVVALSSSAITVALTPLHGTSDNERARPATQPDTRAWRENRQVDRRA